MNGRARSTSAGLISGYGCTRSRRKEPSNSSRTKLGACQSFSRAASATSRASCSVASWVRGGSGWARRSVMVCGVGESGSEGRAQTAQPVQYEMDDVALPLLEIVSVFQGDTHRGSDRACVDQRKPAESDDAEEE